MASFDVQHIDNNSSDSYPSEDFSLLSEIDGSYSNGGINHVNFDFTNMHSALNEVSHDPNAEVSLQLTKLISDNLSLKEALDKNNLMMKEQLSTIPAWRDLMISKTEKQQQKLQEANEKITSLEKENYKLQEKLNNLLEEMCQNKDIRNFCSKCEILESTLNSLFGVKDFIEKDKSTLCSELKKFHENLQQNLIAICHHLNVMLKNKMNGREKNMLKTFILLLSCKIAALNGSCFATVLTDEETGYEIVHQMENKEESVQECSQVSSEICKKLADLKESLTKKDEELDSLRNERDQLSEKVKVYDLKIQELEKASKAQFELLSSKLNHESSVNEKYKERCEILQQQNDEYQVKLDKALMSHDCAVNELHREIHNLQEILKREQQADLRKKEELSRININYEKLQADYERVTKLLEVVSRDEKEKIEKLQALKVGNEKTYLENIDHLTAKLFEVQEQLKERNDKVKEMKESLSVVADESETIPLLKAQIEKLQALKVGNEKTYLENIDHLTAKLFEVQEQLKERNDEVKEMKESLAVVADESETIPLLKAQIEVYKRDFMSLDSACQSAQGEVERLNNELKQYREKSGSAISFGSRKRVEPSSERMKKFLETEKSRNSSPSSSGETESSTTTNKSQKDEFTCPVCGNRFSCLRAAQNHIDRCLDDSQGV